VARWKRALNISATILERRQFATTTTWHRATYTEDPAILASFGSRIRASGAYVTDRDESRHDEEQGEKESYGQHGDYDHDKKLHNGRLKNGQLSCHVS
jgi:hypothetical protein